MNNYCAVRSDLIEFVEYRGINYSCYPKWFNEFIKDGFVVQEFGSHIYASETGDLAICLYDVFLRNTKGDIHYLPRIEFEELCAPMRVM